MLFGSIQMMSAGIENTLVGGIEDDQSWDAQVYVVADGEYPVLDWAENNSAEAELLIEMPIGSVADSDGIERMFTVIGLDNYDNGMRSVNLLDGNKPSQQNTLPQVMMDEGSLVFLEWEVNEIQTVEVNGISQEVEIVGSTRDKHRP